MANAWACLANVHYLRFERFWILIATPALHPCFDEHSKKNKLDEFIEVYLLIYNSTRGRKSRWRRWRNGPGSPGVSSWKRLSTRSFSRAKKQGAGFAKSSTVSPSPLEALLRKNSIASRMRPQRTQHTERPDRNIFGSAAKPRGGSGTENAVRLALAARAELDGYCPRA